MNKPTNCLQNIIKRFVILILTLPLTVCCICAQDISERLNSEEQKRFESFNAVLNNNRYVEQLDSGSFYNLPLGIMGGANEDPAYSITIDEVIFYPDKAVFCASMVLTNPFNNEKMVFAASNVVFSYKGGIVGTYRLELINEKPVSVCKDIGLQILSGSYVECDCKGFRSLKLKGRLQLSEVKYVLADMQGTAQAGKVSAYFETTIQNWNDLTFSVSLDPFQLKQYPDFTFQCENLAVDFSDLRNPENLRFPQSYQNNFAASMINLWRGIYIGEANVILGNKFKRQNATTPISIGVQDLLIDELGFSGKIFGRNLLGINEGNLAGWKFSIDELMLEFNKSNLVGGSLAGLVHVPVFNENTNFIYAAKLDVMGNYAFVVSPQDSVSFKLFGESKLNLYKTSFISIVSKEDKFIPTACFNGNLSINTPVASNSKDGAKVSLSGIEFQNFRVSTQEPFVDIEYFAYHGNNQGSLAKFPITINDIILRKYNAGLKLSVIASVNLKNSSEEGFSGTTGISFLADRDGYRYNYKGLEIDKIRVQIEKPNAFSIIGEIAFARGDEIYGNGFRGMLKATFNKKINIEAVAIFGNVNGLRYFFVDGLYAQVPGIQAGPITIFGFGGGLYHHMKQQVGTIDPNSFGASLSGIVYKPDETIAIGIRATVKLGIVKDELLNAQATFDISFTPHGGIAAILFEGNAQCITPPVNIDLSKFKKIAGKTADPLANKKPDTGTEENRGAISASLHMVQDFQKEVFHTDLEIYVNIAGVLTGVGIGDRAGWAVMHASPDEWYMHIGSPIEPVGLSLLDIIKLKAYFMAGHRLPSTLPINPRVMQILGIDESKIAGKRNEVSMQNAKGIAFGASFEVSTGDMNFLMFYGSFDLGAGFDIMLKNNGANAYCKGRTSPVGINGWYATGQAYAYFAGKIGIQAKVFGKSKKFEIISIATAAFLKAEAPNPVWLVGYVGGEYRILGGMIKGKCRFEVEVGEKCEIMGGRSALANLELISDVSPSDKAGEVDVFTTPQVVFNVPVESIQKISEDNGIQKYFRIKLNKLELKKGSQVIAIEKNWNRANDVVQIIPAAILSPKTEFSLETEIAFEELVNNVWAPFTENGQPLTEKKSINFTTGELPDRIPMNEIAYSYPIERQYNFMPGEYNHAYVMFKRDVQVFFEESLKYDRKARWTKGDNAITSDIKYVTGENILNIDLPTGMALNSIYSLNLVAIPKSDNSNADRNVITSFQNQDTGTDSISMEQKTRAAEGTITTTEEKTLLTFNFKTSQYNTFNSRFSNSQVEVRSLYDRGYFEFYLIAGIPGGEPFDVFERNGLGLVKPLIKMEADLANTPWYSEDVFPHTYEYYPWFNHKSIIWRDTAQYGLYAKKAISIWQSASFSTLSDAEISAGMPLSGVTYSDISYMPPYYWNEDYMDISDGLEYSLSKLSDTEKANALANPTISYIRNTIKLRAVKPGNYPVTLSYMLPGKNIITSSKTFTLHSSLKTDAKDL